MVFILNKVNPFCASSFSTISPPVLPTLTYSFNNTPTTSVMTPWYPRERYAIWPAINQFVLSCFYKDVKCSRYRLGVAQRVGRGIALFFHDRDTRKGRVVSSTPRPHFALGKDAVPILQEAGWAPGLVSKGGKSCPHRDSIPDCPAQGSVVILSYLAHFYKDVYRNKLLLPCSMIGLQQKFILSCSLRQMIRPSLYSHVN